MAHPTYLTKNGEKVPSVTTVLQILNKPYLVGWAYSLGKRGEDMYKVQNDALKIGSYVHDTIEDTLKNRESALIKPPLELMEQVNNCLASFHTWYQANRPVMIHSEKSMVSEKYLYGGTVDGVFNMYGKTYLIDYKTSKVISNEYWIQLAGYASLLEEQGIKVDTVAVLRLPKDSNDAKFEFAQHDWNSGFMTTNRSVFFSLLQAYKAMESLKR